MNLEKVTMQDRLRVLGERNRTGFEWWEEQYGAAMLRLKAPGEFGEIVEAPAGEASIEWDARDSVSVYVAHWGDAVEYSPDDARRLAFDLLALADLVDAASTQPTDSGEGEG